NNRFGDLNALVSKDRDRALSQAEGLLSSLTESITQLGKERDRLRKLSGNLDMSQGEQYLRDLEERKTELNAFMKRLKDAEAAEKDPKKQRLRDLLAQAALRESQAEFEQAMALYGEILAASDEPNVEKRLKELRKAWEANTENEKWARDFIVNVW